MMNFFSKSNNQEAIEQEAAESSGDSIPTAEEIQAANDLSYAEAKARDDAEIAQRPDETQQEYNERVAPQLQPVRGLNV